MSGIAGIYHLDHSPLEPTALQRMTDVVSHRGPDGIHYHVERPLGLAHLQLCTTPESLRERQPLVSSDGRYVVTCDGRIDNRRELIGALRGSSPVGQSSTDVDLLLAAYRRWGEDCPLHVLGDYAFAVRDRERRTLFCARDAVGIRELFYFYDGRRFIFGTEIKQILQVPGIPRRLNELAMGILLAGDAAFGDQTFYRDIKRLRGGHTLTVSPDGIQTRRYWSPAGVRSAALRNGEHEQALLSAFKEAVGAQLRSHRPVGVTLSGGILSRATPEGLKTPRIPSISRAGGWARPICRRKPNCQELR